MRYNKQLTKAAPESMKAMMDFHHVVLSETDSSLDLLTKELIAIGVAVTTQCPYCIDAHVKGARKAGADEAQVAAAVMISSLVKAGGSMTHGWMAMKIMNEG
ncbi:carboxymuconolactone decarboxylase family protein [Rhodococcus opacus]|nr:carboxymuconolactone decarboxylase family protein [Rhodococcus opacus]